MTQLRNVSVYWGTEDGLAPPDTPPCGFHGEFCPDEPVDQECKRLAHTRLVCMYMYIYIVPTCTYTCMFKQRSATILSCICLADLFLAHDDIVIIVVVCAVGGVILVVFTVTFFLRFVFKAAQSRTWSGD